MKWYLEALTKYAEFTGRARRKELWYFILFNNIIGLALLLLDLAIGTFSRELGIGLLSGIYILAILIPHIAVTVRRLHDTDRSGWWVLTTMIPFVGIIFLIAFGVPDGTPGENKYGANPKAVTV